MLEFQSEGRGDSVYCLLRVWYDMTPTSGPMLCLLPLLCLLSTCIKRLRYRASTRWLLTSAVVDNVLVYRTYHSLTWYAYRVVIYRVSVVMHPSACCAPRFAFTGGCTRSGALTPKVRRFCASNLPRRWMWQPLASRMVAFRYQTYPYTHALNALLWCDMLNAILTVNNWWHLRVYVV